MLYLYNFGWDISEPLAITCQLKFLLILDRGASTVTTFDLGWKKDSVLCKLRTNQLCMTAQPWEIAASISMGFSHYLMCTVSDQFSSLDHDWVIHCFSSTPSPPRIQVYPP